MAFAMVISLMPAALAVEGEEGTTPPKGLQWTSGTTSDGKTCEHASATKSEEKKASCKEDGSVKWTCTVCSATAIETISKDNVDHTWGEPQITKNATCFEAGEQTKKCSVCGKEEKEPIPATQEHNYAEAWTQGDTQHYHACTTPECTAKKDAADHTVTWEKTSTTHTGTCSICRKTFSAENHDYHSSFTCKCGQQNTADATGAEANKVSINAGDSKKISWDFFTGSGSSKEYTKTVPDYVLRSDDDCVSILNDDQTIYGEYNGTATVSIYDRTVTSRNLLGSVTVEVKGTSGYSIKASVSADSSGYALGDDDDAGKDSIIDQINSQLRSRERIEDIWFLSVDHKNGELTADKGSAGSSRTSYTESQASSIEFIPDKNAKKGDTAVFELAVKTDDRSSYLYFTVTFNIIDGAVSSGDVEYSATAGKDVTFDSDSFESFWKDNRRSSWKDLEYVTFSLPSSSNGTLYDGDGEKLKSSTKCYVSAGRSQTDLDDVYFEPKSSKAGTVKISFTAYGLNKKNGTDKELSGTVVITYLNGDIDDITYKPGANGKVDLVAKDFTDVFKAATGSSTSSLTITFTSLPDNGTLTYGSRDTKVTKSTTFKTSGSGNKISDVTYTASGSRSDTITYTAASGSTKITGKIIFNPTPANISLQVPYTCTSANGVTFSPADFTSRASALGTNYSLAFAQPTNGGLYYAVIGSQIPAGTKIPVSTLNTVTYRPAANGTVSITFIIYDASGTLAGSGTVTITVTGVTTTPTNPTNPTTPGTTTPTVNDFRDVAADAWYRNDLSRLVNLGVVSGVTSSKFEPLGELNYGAALKLICKAVDVTQPEASGAQWAINYKNYAVQQGWITSDVDLTATIYRTEVAQIAAKALNLSPSSAKPFADSNDPYVAAMNAAGIIRGNDSGLFKGESSLRRSEICAIVCRMLDYRANSFNNEKPGWL